MSGSKSKSSSSNSSTTYDQRTTESINAGIGGDIDDSTVISGIRGNVTMNVTDGGAIKAATDASKAAASTVKDTAKSAFGFGEDALDFASDSLGFAGDAMQSVTDTADRALDFGEEAFDLVQGASDSAIDANTNIVSGALDFGENLLGSVLAYNAEQQSEVLDASTKLTELSMANLAAIKSGETIAKAADRNTVELKNAAIVVAGITAAGVVAVKVFGGKK